MTYSQFETIRKMQNYWKKYYDNKIEKTPKPPFYNLYPYKPSKELVKKLKDDVKNIKVIPTTPDKQ